MPKDCSIEEITNTFSSVGFSSPPSWLKPYHVLSNGEKMRVDLANAILQKNELFVFDEFTSVVDRQIAKIGSFATQKAIRKTNKKFIAVSCHFDIEEWLMPDWVFNTDTMTFIKHSDKKKDLTLNLNYFKKRKINMENV
jgi:ABC-type ATPase with predicted acetyltransferase domain